MKDEELIREALNTLKASVATERRYLTDGTYAEAIAALDRLKLESMEERASYEAELSRLKGDSDEV